jgi:hypothetical protein
MDAQSNRGEEMNKLEALAEKLDTAIRSALIGTEFNGDVNFYVSIFHTPLVDGVEWEWANEALGDGKYPRCSAEYGDSPRKTVLNVFPSIPDTRLATDGDQPF